MSKYDAHVFAKYAVKDLAEARDDVDTALSNVEKLDVTDDVRAAFRQAFAAGDGAGAGRCGGHAEGDEGACGRGGFGEHGPLVLAVALVPAALEAYTTNV